MTIIYNYTLNCNLNSQNNPNQSESIHNPKIVPDNTISISQA